MSRHLRRETKAVGLQPIIGFGLMLFVLGFSYLIAPAVMRFITTADVSLGFLGPIFPISFPANWEPTTRRITVMLLMSTIVFVIVMVPLFAFSFRPGDDPTYVDLTDIRKEREEHQKLLRKGARRRRR